MFPSWRVWLGCHICRALILRRICCRIRCFLQRQGKLSGGKRSRLYPLGFGRARRFGGYRQFGKDPRPCTSFSIAEYSPEERRWRWIVVDKPYPAPVPSGQIFGDACTAYNGKKILLGPGRLTGDEVRIYLSSEMSLMHLIQSTLAHRLRKR